MREKTHRAMSDILEKTARYTKGVSLTFEMLRYILKKHQKEVIEMSNDTGCDTKLFMRDLEALEREFLSSE